jgi:hypothetical protein
MGSKFSQNIKEEKPQETTYNTDKKYNTEVDDTSISFKTNENTEKSSITTTTEVNNDQSKFVPYKFEWKGNNKEVLVTGDFINWEKKLLMKKNPKTGIFELVLFLEKKKHNFKFIVDGQWVCSSQYPTNNDGSNNINNFITLDNYSPNNELIQNEKENKYQNINNLNESLNTNKEENNKNQINIKREDTRKKQYNCRIPLNDELNTIAPIIMWHYRPIFNLEYPSNQDLITSEKNKYSKNNQEQKDESPTKKYLEYREKNFNTENNTYKKIMTCPHEKLMHFCTNLDDIRNIDNNFFRLCTTIRNKHKFLALIYYKPK